MSKEENEALVAGVMERAIAEGVIGDASAVTEPDADSRGDTRGWIRDISMDDGTVVRVTVEAIVYAA